MPDTDAGRLKSLYLTHCGGLTQAQFGEKFDIGSQGMVGQYLNDKTPLNVDVAIKFAQALGVNVADFSSLLALQIESGDERVVRDVMSTQIRPELRADMQEILAQRNNGRRRPLKAYQLYEEAIQEFVNNHKIGK